MMDNKGFKWKCSKCSCWKDAPYTKYHLTETQDSWNITSLIYYCGDCWRDEVMASRTRLDGTYEELDHNGNWNIVDISVLIVNGNSLPKENDTLVNPFYSIARTW